MSEEDICVRVPCGASLVQSCDTRKHTHSSVNSAVDRMPFEKISEKSLCGDEASAGCDPRQPSLLSEWKCFHQVEEKKCGK